MYSAFSADPHDMDCVLQKIHETYMVLLNKIEEIGTIQLTEMSKKEYKIALFEKRNCTEKVKQVLHLSNQENYEIESRKKI